MPEDKADTCARIHTESSRDGVCSHGLNRVERVFLPSVDRQYKRAVELMSILKKEYELNENAEADTALY